MDGVCYELRFLVSKVAGSPPNILVQHTGGWLGVLETGTEEQMQET